MNLIHYSQCPVCDSRRINPLLTVNDYSISKEDFVIWQCADCTLRFTQDVPDEESIGRYYASSDYISHSNTSTGLINKLYQRVRKHTLVQKANLIIESTKPQGNILDVGAGIGAFLSVMKEKGWRTTGIEPDVVARTNAKQLYGLTLDEPAQLFDLPERNFDAITMWHVLEHVHRLQDYVAQLKSLLQPDGKLVVAVPNYTSGDADAYRNFWAAYDVPRHLYHFTPQAMQALMQRHGLKIIAKKPMWFDSFYVSLLSSKYKNGDTSWISAGWNGLTSNIGAAFNTDKCSSVIYVIGR